jgi:hypothetical protein
MGDRTNPAADGDLKVAPAPELAENSDETGVRRGLAVALTLGGLIWAAAAAAAIYFLRH